MFCLVNIIFHDFPNILISYSMIKKYFDMRVLLLNLTIETYQPWLSENLDRKIFVIFLRKLDFIIFSSFFYEITIFRNDFNIWRSYFGKSKWNKSVHITVPLLKQSEAISAKIAEEEKASYFQCRFVIIYHNSSMGFSSHNA